MPSRTERPRDSARGAVTLEVTGLILVAALLVSAVSVAVLDNDRVGRAVSSAVCRILSLGQGSCGAASSATTDPHLPTEPCTTDASGYTVGAEAAAFNFNAGRASSVSIDRLSNGQYRVTVTDGGSGGLETGAGWEAQVGVNGSTYGLDIGASAAARAHAGQARIYVADTREAAQDIADWATYETTRDAAADSAGIAVPGAGWVARHVISPVTDFAAQKLGLKKPPSPDATLYVGGVSANASAWDSMGVLAFEGSASVDAVLGYRQNADGSVTLIGEASGSLTGSASALWKNGEVGPDGRGTVEATYKDGQLTSVSFTGTTVSGADSTVHTWTLPVTSDADRSAANALLYNPLPTSWSAFFDASKDHGQLSRVSYRTEGLDLSAAGSAWFVEGGALRAQFSTPTTKVTDAEYYNGQGWAPWSACRSGG